MLKKVKVKHFVNVLSATVKLVLLFTIKSTNINILKILCQFS